MREIKAIYSSWEPPVLPGPAATDFLAKALISIAGKPIRNRTEKVILFCDAFNTGLKHAVARAQGRDDVLAKMMDRPGTGTMLRGLRPVDLTKPFDFQPQYTTATQAGSPRNPMANLSSDPGGQLSRLAKKEFLRLTSPASYRPPSSVPLAAGSVCEFLSAVRNFQVATFASGGKRENGWNALGLLASPASFVADRLVLAACGTNPIPDAAGFEDYSVIWANHMGVLDTDGTDSMREYDTAGNAGERKQAFIGFLARQALYPYAEVVGSYVSGWYSTVAYLQAEKRGEV